MMPSRNTPSDLASLRGLMEQTGISLPVDDDVSVLAEPLPLGGGRTSNRLVALPMEGCDGNPDGSPSQLTVRRYARIAAGGSGCIWFEATAAAREGRSNNKALWLHQGNAESFRRLVDATRAAAGGAVVCILQLTHAGRYARPEGTPRPVLVHRAPLFDDAAGIAADHPLATDADLDALQDSFLEAARLARIVGFDGVDMKCCHGYLASSLLGARERAGRYGGSYENRTRFVRETAARIRGEIPGILLASRLGIYDGAPYPYGWGVSPGPDAPVDLQEPLRLAADLSGLGACLIGVTMGNPRFDPHFGRPSRTFNHALPPSGEHPLIGINRLISCTAEIQRAIPRTPAVIAGLGWLGHLMPFVAAGVVKKGFAQAVGQGRGIIAYPESAKDILDRKEMERGRACVTCSLCSALMRQGGPSGCAVRDRGYFRLVRG